jgi:CPA2 family monovalent cation:H+ antiporter-2
VLFALVDRYLARPGASPRPADEPGVPEAPEMASREPVRATTQTGHVVLVGYGRVGRIIAEGLKEQGLPVLLIEEIRPIVLQAREAGVEVIHGNATNEAVLGAANIPAARSLLVAIPDAFEGGQVVAQARAVSPTVRIVARSHSDEETEHLKKHGANAVIMGEREIALAMLADVRGKTATC